VSILRRTRRPAFQAAPTDAELLLAASGIELAMVAVYDAAIAAGVLDQRGKTLVTTYQEHHRQHSASFDALSGRTGVANQAVITDFTAKVKAATSSAAMLQVAFDIEQALAATHLDSLGKAQGARPANQLGAVLPVESQHAVVIGESLHFDINQYTPSFESVTGALTSGNPA